MLTIYEHYRAEMRAFYDTCDGDIDVFINCVGDMVGRLFEEHDRHEAEIIQLEEQLDEEISTICHVHLK